MSIRSLVVSLALLAGNQAFGAYFYELSTTGPERLTTYAGGGQFRGSLYEGATAATASLIGTFASQCVDFLNVFPPNTRYQVSVSTLSEAGMATTRWGSWDGSDAESTPGQSSDFDTAWSSARLDNAGSIAYTALERYMMAAWLMTRMQQYTVSPSSSADPNRNAIQDVIWEVLNPQSSGGIYTAPPPLFNGSSTNDALVQSWWTAARTTGLSQDSGFYSQFRVITESPINNTDGVYQEQIVRVPEPGDITLALALVAVFWLVRRRRVVPV